MIGPCMDPDNMLSVRFINPQKLNKSLIDLESFVSMKTLQIDAQETNAKKAEEKFVLPKNP